MTVTILGKSYYGYNNSTNNNSNSIKIHSQQSVSQSDIHRHTHVCALRQWTLERKKNKEKQTYNEPFNNAKQQKPLKIN